MMGGEKEEGEERRKETVKLNPFLLSSPSSFSPF